MYTKLQPVLASLHLLWFAPLVSLRQLIDYTDHEVLRQLTVSVPQELGSNPEQVLELARICKPRGYEDSFSARLRKSYHKGFHFWPQAVADILSLTEIPLVAPPKEGNA